VNSLLGHVSHRGPNPEQEYAEREQERILRDAIRTLRPEIRRAVELQTLREQSLKETAQALGLSVDAAKSRLHQARAALRESLRKKNARVASGTRRFHLPPAA
jgi:RNA polymerase sigma-70 factor, ECF subfamily